MSQRDHVEDSQRRPAWVQREQRNCSYGLVRDYIEVVKAMLREEVHLPLRMMDRMEAPQEIDPMPGDMACVTDQIPCENRQSPRYRCGQHSVRDQLERAEQSALDPNQNRQVERQPTHVAQKISKVPRNILPEAARQVALIRRYRKPALQYQR